MNTGESKPIKDWAEAETYLPEPAEARDATADLPEDFDLDAIPVEKLPVKVRAAYSVKLDDAEAGVPVAFEEQGQMRIPVKGSRRVSAGALRSCRRRLLITGTS